MKIERKGVKMFKGLKFKKNKIDENFDSSSLMDNNISKDENDEVDEDTDTLPIINKVENKDDEDQDFENEDGDEDEEEEEKDENKDSKLGLKVLLGDSIVDDDDDEDFNEENEDEDDDNENEDGIKVIKQQIFDTKNIKGDKQVEKEKKKQLSPEAQEKIDKRTIFIDNVPKETKSADIKKVFRQFGPINNLRFRGIIPANPKFSKKIAAIKNNIHPKVTTVTVYVNYKSEESARKALDMNGKIFQENYVHVRIAAKSVQKEFDSKKSVFLGNLKFGIDNNSIWKCFSECGDIESVHLIRDSKTGQTKGSGYVNFKTEDAATLALKLDGVEILNRPVRVQPYLSDEKRQRKNKRKGKKRDFSNEVKDNKSVKRFKNNLGKTVMAKSEIVGKAKKQQQESQKNHSNFSEKKQMSFQGQKADMRNKRKHHNKLNKKRKEMAEKLIAKTKTRQI